MKESTEKIQNNETRTKVESILVAPSEHITDVKVLFEIQNLGTHDAQELVESNDPQQLLKFIHAIINSVENGDINDPEYAKIIIHAQAFFFELREILPFPKEQGSFWTITEEVLQELLDDRALSQPASPLDPPTETPPSELELQKPALDVFDAATKDALAKLPDEPPIYQEVIEQDIPIEDRQEMDRAVEKDVTSLRTRARLAKSPQSPADIVREAIQENNNRQREAITLFEQHGVQPGNENYRRNMRRIYYTQQFILQLREQLNFQGDFDSPQFEELFVVIPTPQPPTPPLSPAAPLPGPTTPETSTSPGLAPTYPTSEMLEDFEFTPTPELSARLQEQARQEAEAVFAALHHPSQINAVGALMRDAKDRLKDVIEQLKPYEYSQANPSDIDRKLFESLHENKLFEEALIQELQQRIYAWELHEPQLPSDELTETDRWSRDLYQRTKNLQNPVELQNVLYEAASFIGASIDFNPRQVELEHMAREYMLHGKHVTSTDNVIKRSLEEYEHASLHNQKRTLQIQALSETIQKLAEFNTHKSDGTETAHFGRAKQADKNSTEVRSTLRTAINPRAHTIDIASLRDLALVPDLVHEEARGRTLSTINARLSKERLEEKSSPHGNYTIYERLPIEIPPNLSLDILSIKQARIDEAVIPTRIELVLEVVREFSGKIKLSETNPGEVVKLLTERSEYEYYVDPGTIERPLPNPIQETEFVNRRLSQEFNVANLNFSNPQFLELMSGPTASELEQEFIAQHVGLHGVAPDMQSLLDGNHDAITSHTLELFADICRQYHSVKRYEQAVEIERGRMITPGPERDELRKKQEKAFFSNAERKQTEQEMIREAETLWDDVWSRYDVHRLHTEFAALQENLTDLQNQSNDAYALFIKQFQDKSYTYIPNSVRVWQDSCLLQIQQEYLLKKMKEYTNTLRYDNGLPQPPGSICPESLLTNSDLLEKTWKDNQKKLDTLIKDPKSHNAGQVLNQVLQFGFKDNSLDLVTKGTINTKRLVELAVRRRAIDYVLGRYDELSSLFRDLMSHPQFTRGSLTAAYPDTYISATDKVKLADALPGGTREWASDEILDARDQKELHRLEAIDNTRGHIQSLCEGSEDLYQDILKEQLKFLDARYIQVQGFINQRTDDSKQLLGTAFFAEQGRDKQLKSGTKESVYITTTYLPEKPSNIADKELFGRVLPAMEAMSQFMMTYHEQLNAFSKREYIPTQTYKMLLELPLQLLKNKPIGQGENASETPIWLDAKDMEALSKKLENLFNYKLTDNYPRDTYHFPQDVIQQRITGVNRAKSDYSKFLDPKVIAQYPHDIQHFELLLKSALSKVREPRIANLFRSKFTQPLAKVVKGSPQSDRAAAFGFIRRDTYPTDEFM